MNSNSSSHNAILKLFGLSEAYIGNVLNTLKLPDSVKILSRPHFPEVWITCEDVGSGSNNQVREAIDVISRATGEQFIIARSESETLEANIGKLLLKTNSTLSVAESCTGGALASRVVSVPGSSEYFLSAVVGYSNHAKVTLLGVSQETLEQQGSVSKEVAEQMATNIRALTGASYGISTTGIAGPGGATSGKPVGTVWLGLASSDFTEAFVFHIPLPREMFRSFVAHLALDLLRRKLLGYPLRYENPVTVHEEIENTP